MAAIPDLIPRDLMNVSIVGSSFVKRLRDDIDNRVQAEFKRNFGFDEMLVDYVCRGGWRIGDLEEHVEEIVYQWPDIIIIQCGGNDLLGSSRPETVADRILETAEQIRYKARAKLVMVGEVLPRELGKYLVTEEEVDRFKSDHDQHQSGGVAGEDAPPGHAR